MVPPKASVIGLLTALIVAVAVTTVSSATAIEMMGTGVASTVVAVAAPLLLKDMVSVCVPGFPVTVTCPDPTTFILFAPSGPTGPPVLPVRNWTSPAAPPPTLNCDDELIGIPFN
jgi:hypothetical protein